MDDLIKALEIFRKYTGGDIHNPTHCEHDTFHVLCTHDVSSKDAKELDRLSFNKGDDGVWHSYRFGSA